MQDVGQSERPSVTNDDVMQKVRQNTLCISPFCNEFPQVSTSVVHEVVADCQNFIAHARAADLYEDEIKKLVVRYDKYLNIGGNYVEK